MKVLRKLEKTSLIGGNSILNQNGLKYLDEAYELLISTGAIIKSHKILVKEENKKEILDSHGNIRKTYIFDYNLINKEN